MKTNSLVVDFSSTGITVPDDLHVLELSDDSMIDAGLHTGDIVILAAGYPKRGDIVAVEVSNRQVLRRYLIIAGIPHVLAENSLRPDLRPAYELCVYGVVWGFIRIERDRRPKDNPPPERFSYLTSAKREDSPAQNREFPVLGDGWADPPTGFRLNDPAPIYRTSPKIDLPPQERGGIAEDVPLAASHSRVNPVPEECMPPLGTQLRLGERLREVGAAALSNVELVTLLLEDNAGDQRSAVNADLAQRTMRKFRSLRALARCGERELALIEDMANAKAVRLSAALELGRRAVREVPVKLVVDSPEVVCKLIAQDLRALTRESLRVLLLDTKYHLLGIEEISIGSLYDCIAHPREIFRPALLQSAYAVILVHNHPSGDPSPSKADRVLTERIVEVGDLLDVKVVDHVIIGDFQAKRNSYYSFMESGAI